MAKRKGSEFVVYSPHATKGPRPCVRLSETSAELGVLLPHDPDAPLPKRGELVELEPVAPGVAAVQAYGRPPMVNSRSYEEGWERIFGGSNSVGEA